LWRLIREGDRHEIHVHRRRNSPITGKDWVKPFAAAYFEKYSQLQSIMLLVVQPENEFICDAVYDKYIFSILKNPDLSAARASEYQLSKDLVNLPGFDWEINEVMRSWRKIKKSNYRTTTN